MIYSEYLGDSFNENTNEFNSQTAQENVAKKKSKLNILLLGATGSGKSSLVNAMFGGNIVESGVGKPITQFLEKIEIPNKGITLWDTKGIEAKDYENTKSQLINDIKTGFSEAFETGIDEHRPHVAWLCIKETSSRIEQRELDLLSIAQEYGIPAVIVFTYTQYEAGEEFVNAAKDELNNSFKHFLKDRFIRVNSQNYQIMNTEVKTSGLENLLEATVSCLADVSQTTVNEQAKRHAHIEALMKAQEIDSEKKLIAMTESAKNKVHIAAVAAATVGASPIPGSDAPLIAAVQSTLIYTLNSEFEVDSNTSKTTTTIAGILGVTAIAQVGKALVANVLKFIPGGGTILGGAISAATAAAITEAVGHAYIKVLISYYDYETCKVNLPEVSVLLNTFETVFKQIYKNQSDTDVSSKN